MLHNREKLQSLLEDEKTELIHGKNRYEISVETKPQCTENCPAGINVKGYVNLISNKKYEDALELIRDANPFPGICGRVCTHPCEFNCERGDDGDPLSIKALKRFVYDYEVSRSSAKVKENSVKYKEKIAVIGSGPAGLTAALDLSGFGYSVTVFEAMDKPGGMLEWGIPKFRLPRVVVKRELDIIMSAGVKINTGTRISHPRSLLSRGFDVVVIATGSWVGLPLKIPGEKLEGALDCLEFLRNVYRDEITELKNKRVVVIGGGDSAVDASRTALRLGAKEVILAYRRTENEMPASHSEVREAKEEGIDLRTLVIPKSIKGEKYVQGIRLIKAELGGKDESGRRRPVPVKDSEFTIECDMVIPAISAKPDLTGFSDAGIEVSDRGLMVTDKNFKTGIQGLYALGDAVRGPSTIVDVIGDAHICASSVHSDLREELNFSKLVREDTRATVSIKEKNPEKTKGFPIPLLSPEERKTNFREIEKGYSEYTAVQESSRCRTCSSCNECDICFPTCNFKQLVGSINRKKFLMKVPASLSRKIHNGKTKGWKFITKHGKRDIKLSSLTPKVDKKSCIACGRCEDACAYRAVRVGLKSHGKAYSYIDHDVCRSCGRCVLACPTGAISLDLYSESNFNKQIRNTILSNSGIAVFGCHWTMPETEESGVHTVELMCSVGITPAVIIQSFAYGAKGILIQHCGDKNEHYLDVEYGISDIVRNAKELLKLIGMEPERIEITNSENLEETLAIFTEKLKKFGLQGYPTVPVKPINGIIGREVDELNELASMSGNKVSSLLLKSKVLSGAGLPDLDEMLGATKKISQLTGTKIDPVKVNECVITPVDSEESEVPNLPFLLKDPIDKLEFRKRDITVGIHRACSHDDDGYHQPIKELIDVVPGCKSEYLSIRKCGATNWREPKSGSREMAMKLYHEAEERDINLIITTSADCLTHMRACNREGAWRHSSIPVTDIFSFLVDSLKGGDDDE